MSVPLDRLYHYLDDCVNHDLLIYRWAPHGSRKLEDLNQIKFHTDHETCTLPIVIFHDQEPLNYNFYTQDQIHNRAKNQFSKSPQQFMLKDSVLNYISAQHLRAITMCTNDYDLTIIVHSEQRSQQVELFSKKNFVPVYYWSHALIAQDWFRYAAHDPNLDYNLSNIKLDFLIYNRAWSGTREYRLMFAENLINNNLAKNCKTTFSPVDQNTHYTNHNFTNKKFIIQHQQLENCFPLNTYPATASADYVSDDYTSTGIEIVLETLFDDSRWHLTEKSLRPIACGKPFILMSTPGSLDYLRSYGFETFNGLINESYDTIINSKDRLDAVISEMKRIAALDPTAKQVLYAKLHEIAQRNKHRFFNGLTEQVINEYKTNLNHAMDIMNRHCSGKHRTVIRQLLQN